MASGMFRHPQLPGAAQSPSGTEKIAVLMLPPTERSGLSTHGDEPKSKSLTLNQQGSGVLVRAILPGLKGVPAKTMQALTELVDVVALGPPD